MAIAIIGTGLAGLACAQRVAGAGRRVVLFDKSRGYGGRMASRRREGVAFDHGVPCFDPVAEETIATLADLPLWDSFGRVAAPRMNAFPRKIGESFESHMGARITALDPEAGILTDETGVQHSGFSAIAVAIPAPQAHELLTGQGAMFAPVAEATYAPCWTLMLGGVSGESSLPPYAVPESGPLGLILRDDAKPGHPAPHPCYVAHARRQWSRANLERDADAVAEDLCRAFAALTGLDTAPAPYRAAHRWRYAQPERVVDAPFLLDTKRRVGACGDWCGADRTGGDARAAWRSGDALAGAMLAL